MNEKEKCAAAIAFGGKALMMLDTVEDKERKALAALVQVKKSKKNKEYLAPVEGFAQKFREWLFSYYDSQKAIVDESTKPEKKKDK